MEEFFRQNYVLATLSVELIAAITGFFYYKKYKHTAAKFLVYFLVYAFIIEIAHSYTKFLWDTGNFNLIENTLFEKNLWLSNIFWFGGLVSFVFYINFRIIKKPLYKLALRYCYIIYLALFLIYGIFNFSLLFTIINPFIAILSLWMIFVSVAIYYVEILQSDDLLYFYKSIYFYVNSCVFFWTLIVVPMTFYDIYNLKTDWNFVILKWKIYLFINFTFYLTLTLALIFCKSETK